MILGILVVWAITYFNPATGSGNGINVSVDELNFKMGVFVFFAGVVAISAMVLPGISGSTLLLIFGLYAPILGAIKEVIRFNFNYFPVVLIFGTGIVSGILITIKGVKYLLEHFRTQTMYLVLGLMIGSLYAIVMGPETLESAKPAMTMHSFRVFYFFIGGVLILVLEKLRVWIRMRALRVM